MALSKQRVDSKKLLAKDQHSESDDLTSCGICQASVVNPKALPCLHTYCLKCLEEWVKGKNEKIPCPVCKEDFPLPQEGVSGFRSNFFVTRLKEKEALKGDVTERKSTCTSCDVSGKAAVSWCTDCKANLCIDCVKSHKTLKHLKKHHVYSLDEIKSGKVNINITYVTEYCTTHKKQVLWFFCETCGVLICRDCTVVDHPASKHTLVNVEEISGTRGKKTVELSSRCQRVVQEVDDAIKVANDVENDLTVALQNATSEVAQITAQIKDSFLANLKQKEQQLMNELTKIGGHHKSQIKVQKDTLMSQKLQLKRALEMTACVTENGSPYDIAAMHTTLTNTLKKLSDIKPNFVPDSLSEVTFVANKEYQAEIPKLGNFRVKKAGHDVRGEWEMESQFRQKSKLQYGTSIAEYPTGDIAVTDNLAAQVKIFHQNGKFKHNIDVKVDAQASHPKSVAISPGGVTYVTDESSFVKVFDVHAKLINRFQTKPPPTGANKKYASLYGMAINGNVQVVVGEHSNKYVSIHTLSGSHINSFNVTIPPYSIAAAPQNTLLICSGSGAQYAQILNYAGEILHTINSTPIPGKAWCPSGAHFISNKKFIITSQCAFDKLGGIYHYSTKGEYLGQIAKDVSEPIDVIITKAGKLVVLERKCVRMFKKK